jgi:hypothetical protein
MKRQWCIPYAFFVLLIPVATRAQQWSGIITPSRAVDWSHAGASGGGAVPNRTTICATLGLLGQVASFAQSVTLAQINSAMGSCPSGQTVLLNPGVYTLVGGIDITKPNVTLRGAGADQTTLITGGGGISCGGLGSNICVQGSQNWSGGPAHSANWTGTTEGGPGVYPHGATHLILNDVTGLTVGNTIILDQADDATDGFPQTGDIFVCGVGGSCVGQGTNSSRVGRGQQQTVTVTAISGTTVTVSPGLAMPNWRSSQNPGAWWADSVIQGVGIENLTLDNSAGLGALCSGCGNIVFNNAANSWVRGVRSIEHNGTGGNPVQAHMRLYISAHITIQDSYLYGSDNWAQSYGIELFETSDNLIQNNICQHVTACTVINGPDSGSVIAYNFSIDDNYTGGGTAPQWMQPTHVLHEIGEAMELYEGNSGLGFQADNIHGTHHFGTFFRNHYYGDIWNNPAKWNNTELIHLWKYARFFNIVGNVLGSSYYNTYQGTSATSIFNVNGDSDGENGEPTANDPRVAATLLRWGNYDTVTGTVRFVVSEVPSGITNYANPVPSSTTLPASFYLISQPSWWVFPSGTTAPFPGTGPDVTGGNGPGGHSYYNPAENCWYTVMQGVVGVSGLLSFNAGQCYPTSGQLAPPTNLQISVH